ncbi:MAG: metal-dependent hydrolase [Cellulosilyticaceae bacterium]
MKFKTHIAGGVALGIGVAYFLDYSFAETALFYGAVLVGSLLPDIDHTKSFLGSRLLLFSKPLNKWFGHRTLTHSLLTVGLLFYSSFAAWGFLPITTGLFTGCISHILLDSLTNKGVAIFYPLSKKRYRLGRLYYKDRILQ